MLVGKDAAKGLGAEGVEMQIQPEESPPLKPEQEANSNSSDGLSPQKPVVADLVDGKNTGALQEDRNAGDGYKEPTVGSRFFDAKIDAIAELSVTKPWKSLCGCYGIIFLVIILGITCSGAIFVPSGFYEW